MKKWVIGIITAIIIVPSLSAGWLSFRKALAMGEKQETYEEAIVNINQFTTEQRSQNVHQEEQFEVLKEDQTRQWSTIELLLRKMLDDK